MKTATTPLTQKALFNYALIAAELFPMLDDVQGDEVFFTSREREVLHHLLRDKSLHDISHALDLSLELIDHHIESIKGKMKLTHCSESVIQLTRQFALAGWYF